MQSRSLILGAVLALAVLVPIGGVASTYNTLVRLDQSVTAQWAQVENACQRRADLVPNLVAVVKAAASHERETLEAVTAARAHIGGLAPDALRDPQALQRYQAAQEQLSSAISRLVAVAEAYPQLRANENFLALQAQLEGTENRISVERQRFNDEARAFNTRRDTFPTVLFVGAFGDRFAAKAYFTATAEAKQAPRVEI